MSAVNTAPAFKLEFFCLLFQFKQSIPNLFIPAQESLTKGLGTVDLLVLTSLDQRLFILKILCTIFTKQAILIRRSTELSLPPQ
jgi:hypothetical protein